MCILESSTLHRPVECPGTRAQCKCTRWQPASATSSHKFHDSVSTFQESGGSIKNVSEHGQPGSFPWLHEVRVEGSEKVGASKMKGKCMCEVWRRRCWKLKHDSRGGLTSIGRTQAHTSITIHHCPKSQVTATGRTDCQVTDRVTERTGWSSRLQETYGSFQRNL